MSKLTPATVHLHYDKGSTYTYFCNQVEREAAAHPSWTGLIVSSMFCAGRIHWGLRRQERR
jgi:hypothetical protein